MHAASLDRMSTSEGVSDGDQAPGGHHGQQHALRRLLDDMKVLGKLDL